MLILASNIILADNSVSLSLKSKPFVKILSKTDFDTELTHDFSYEGDKWNVKVCHKDYNKNKNEKIGKDKKALDNYPIQTIKKGKDKQKNGINKTLDLKNNPCITQSLDNIELGDELKLGYESTLITLTEDNATITVTPETDETDYLLGKSYIDFFNNGTDNITFYGLNLNIEVDAVSEKIYYYETVYENVSYYNYTCDEDFKCISHNTLWGMMPVTYYRETTENLSIIIQPEESKRFYVEAILSEPYHTYKYNVTFTHPVTQEIFSIDPYFITTDSEFNNGTFENTLLNVSGFVQINLSGGAQGNYTSQIFDSGITNSTWQNITWFQKIALKKQLPNNKGTVNGDYIDKVPMEQNVLLFHFNDTGSPIKDYSGEGYDSVVIGVPVFQAEGKIGYSIDLDGLGKHIEVGRPQKLIDIDTNLTVQFWFYSRNNSNQHLMFDNCEAFATIGYCMVIWTDTVSFYLGNGVPRVLSYPIINNTWYHVAGTYDGVAQKLYVNGVLTNSSPVTAPLLKTLTENITVGENSLLSSSYYDGLFDELAIYNRTLSGTEILNHYRRGISNLNLSVRTCDDSLCSGESYTSFNFPSNQIGDSPLQLSLPLNRYFQYRYNFYSEDTSFSPELYNVTIGYESFCTENWVEDAVVCQINDTYLSTFTDLNGCGSTINLSAQNGTYQICNYCSPDLVQNLGTCTINNNQTVDYTDNNYGSCCSVTGLTSDCPTDATYPYNETTSQACGYFNNTLTNISCQNEPNFNIREKEYCLAYIPNEYLNETFKCISYVYDLNSNEILQTNPEYRERTSTLIDLGKDPETRQYFEPANAIINFYYTKKNLDPEQDYVLSIDCSSLQRTLQSQTSFSISYENFDFLFYRIRWFKSNWGYVLVGMVVIFLLLLMGWVLISPFKR